MIRAARRNVEEHLDGRDGSDDEYFERLATASVGLRARCWKATERRPTGNALRATVLELAELIDAASSARSSLEGNETHTLAYLDRLGWFVTHASEAVVAVAIDPSADVRPRLSKALTLWAEQVPWDVMLEIAWDEGIDPRGAPRLAVRERHVFEASAAWERAARGLIHLGARTV